MRWYWWLVPIGFFAAITAAALDTGPQPVPGGPAARIWVKQVSSGAITVSDGDTVRRDGKTWRLVGFDAPETGHRAKCDVERKLGEDAKARLQELVAAGVDFAEVVCNCPAGTHGTRACNHGRGCATLTSNGRDVGDILTEESLARPYRCSGTRCPPRRPWC